MPKLGHAALLLSVSLMLTGCSTSTHSANNTTAPAVAPAPRPSTGCPSPTTTAGRGAAVDYVDFIQANGLSYVVPENLGLPPVKVPAADIGDVQFLVRCALSPLNEQTKVAPPPPRDGDAAFIPEGTPVHAVKGWPTLCRLAAQHHGEWHVYLATDPHSTTAKPQPCAATPTTPPTASDTVGTTQDS